MRSNFSSSVVALTFVSGTKLLLCSLISTSFTLFFFAVLPLSNLSSDSNAMMDAVINIWVVWQIFNQKVWRNRVSNDNFEEDFFTFDVACSAGLILSQFSDQASFFLSSLRLFSSFFVCIIFTVVALLKNHSLFNAISREC